VKQHLALLTESEISARLDSIPTRGVFNPFPAEFFPDHPSSAAILIPFTCIDGDWHLLFIRRTRHAYDRHGGQGAFPGGRVDAVDSNIIAAALREAWEEVGLNPGDVRILGQMDDFHSVTNYLVTPIVGAFDSPYTFSLDPKEVDRAFTIPLIWLANPDNFQLVRRHFPKSRPWPIIYFDPYDGEALWGFTAQVVVQLLKILGIAIPD
jgi:8-oxo-dGTP pyrophosphatase MutT (NUDIX family)